MGKFDRLNRNEKAPKPTKKLKTATDSSKSEKESSMSIFNRIMGKSTEANSLNTEKLPSKKSKPSTQKSTVKKRKS